METVQAADLKHNFHGDLSLLHTSEDHLQLKSALEILNCRFSN